MLYIISTLMMKAVAKLGIIAIVLVNTEALYLAYVSQNIVYQKKYCGVLQAIKIWLLFYHKEAARKFSRRI